jgi:hypothetical protein
MLVLGMAVMVMSDINGKGRVDVRVGANDDRYCPMLEAGHISRCSEQAQSEEQCEQRRTREARDRRGGPHPKHGLPIARLYSRVRAI